MHIVDILSLRAKVVIHHLLETETDKDTLHLSGEFLYRRETSDREISRHDRLEQ